MNYEIMIRHDFSELIGALSGLSIPLSKRRVMIICDSNIDALYGQELKELLSGNCRDVFLTSFPAGEEHKNYETILHLLESLTLQHFDRKDLILAFGGGVTGDIAGFTASIYMRGIDFVQIPTSLLAQVDSSIGGKTGIDFLGFKNLVGAFYEPKLVYMNLSLLRSLPEREYACGLGEILKHSLLRSPSYYAWLNAHREQILARDPETIADMIAGSCEIKSEVVEQDLTEQGIRAYLNLGHTLGHAIEKECGYSQSHGACVSIGLSGAIYLSEKKGFLSHETAEEMRRFLASFAMPVSISGLSREAVFHSVFSDKKVQHGKIRFVLLREIGDVFVCSEVTDEEIKEAISVIVLP